MKEEKLILLIEKYFQGETSLKEERQLWREVQRSTSLDPAVEEARAVMAYTRMKRTFGKGNERARCYKWPVRTAVAAAVMLAILIPLYNLIREPSQDSVCTTMIACHEDNSHEVAFDLIASQLEAVSIASEEVAEDVREGLMLISEF